METFLVQHATTFGGPAAKRTPFTDPRPRSCPPAAPFDFEGGSLPPIRLSWDPPGQPAADPPPPAQPRIDTAPVRHLSAMTGPSTTQKFATAPEWRRPEAEAGAGHGPVPALPQLFAQSQQTLSELWDRMDVPPGDRQQFASVAFADVTTDNLKTLNDEIQRLLDRRTASVHVEQSIEIREGFLYLLQDLSNRISVEAFDRDKTAREAMPLISSLRAASLDVVDAVLKWREVVSDPQAIYLWKGTSYLKKMQDDVAFVAGSQIAAVLDCDANNNPFFYTRPPRERAAHDPASQAQRDASGAHSGLVLPHAAYPRVPYEQLLGTHPAIDARPMSASKRRLPPVKQRRGDTTHADACSSRIAAAERALRDEVRLLALGQPSGSGTRPGSAPLARGGGSSCATAERGQRRQTQRGDAEADGELESLRDPDSLTETLVQQRALEHRAATQIQSCWRASCERELLGVKALQKRAAIRIQRLARGYLAKREVTQRLRRHNAARRIQAGARGMLVRSAVSHLLLEHVAATQIQSAWRGCRGRKIARQRLLRRRGATDIQQVWRGYYARSRLDAVDQAKRRWAAAAIQGVWRGARVRAQPEFDARKIRAAIRIQAWWRGLLAREYHRWLRHRRDAGVHLQSWWRGLLARSYVNGLRDAEQEKDYRAFLRHADRRALDIQRVWRGHCARKTASGKGRS